MGFKNERASSLLDTHLVTAPYFDDSRQKNNYKYI